MLNQGEGMSEIEKAILAETVLTVLLEYHTDCSTSKQPFTLTEKIISRTTSQL